MADKFDNNSSDSCEDVNSRTKSDSLVGYVIQQALMDSDEEIPEENDEFWKPVSKTFYQDGDISAFDKNNGNLNLNQMDMYDAESSYSDTKSLRKAVSDDSIEIKRRQEIKAEIPNKTLSPCHSEKGSPETKINQPQQSTLNESAELESSSSEEDEIDASEEQFDFFREYELKVDLLEYCDMAVEESFDILKHHVLHLHEMTKTSEHDKEGITNKTETKQQTNEEPNQESDDTAVICEKETDENVVLNDNTELSEGKERTQNVGSDKREDNTETGGSSNVHDKVLLVADVLQILRNRFENFIAEVSEIVHLGALSVRHAQRVDHWGGEVQKTNQRIFADHQRMKAYLEEQEACWGESREQYQAEIYRQGQQITDILQRLHLYNDEPESHRKYNNYYKNVEIVNSVLMKRRCQEEQALTLDFARQSKISELKLLVIQQQGYIQRLQLKNNELNGVIRDVLYKPTSPIEAFDESEWRDGCQLQNISDVLNCDHAGYIPHRSTDPDTVGRQVFNIGDTKSNQGPTCPLFDPRKLSYICLDALPVKYVDCCEKKNSSYQTEPENPTYKLIDDQSDENGCYLAQTQEGSSCVTAEEESEIANRNETEDNVGNDPYSCKMTEIQSVGVTESDVIPQNNVLVVQ